MNRTALWLFAAWTCLLVSLGGASPARAQFPDLLDLSGQYVPEVPLDEPKPTRVQVASYDATLNIPLRLSTQTFLIPGASYRVDAAAFSQAAPEFTELRAFHAIEGSLLLVQLLPRETALSLRVAPALAGDFQSLDVGMLRLSAMVLATHSFSDSFVFGGGALASYGFGALLPLPALYLEWKPLPGTSFETFLPAFATLKQTFAERVEIGLRADVSGNAYAVRDARITRAYPCAAQANDDPATVENERRADRPQCMDHIAYSVGTVGAFAGVRLFSSVWISAFAGRTVFRRLEQQNEDGKRIAGGLQWLADQAFVRANLTWRIPRGD